MRQRLLAGFGIGNSLMKRKGVSHFYYAKNRHIGLAIRIYLKI